MDQEERLASIDRRLDTLITVSVLGLLVLAIVGIFVGLIAFGVVDVHVEVQVPDSGFGSDLP